jgi:hypothetical protein
LVAFYGEGVFDLSVERTGDVHFTDVGSGETVACGGLSD